jgi:hypothetical protein|tara:strand:+ start:502 stop:1044 length:543 start_codon:yes stop_codon:yes gene_type:complete
MTTLNEGLDYLDLENQLIPIVTVDEYAAKMGADKDIVTLAFTVKSELAGDDLVSWFERGYDFVLDASVSEGEITIGKYLVFVELTRRFNIIDKIILLISDLETLTGMNIKDWTVVIEDEEYPCEVDILKEKIIVNPNVYKEKTKIEDELNEMRLAAGLDHKSTILEKDTYIKDLQAAAGL